MNETQYLTRPEGNIAYDDSGGDGPVVIAAPGMGDMRGVYRHIAPALIESGIRLVTTDLRGLGESSVGWDDLSDEAVASDLLALVDELDVRGAVLVGSSLSCASAVIAATDAPNEIAAIALIGPFVRPTPRKWWENGAFAAMLAPPWGKGVWVTYYRKNFYPGPMPVDHDSYVKALSDNLGEKGRMASLRGLARNRHEESGRRFKLVSQPVLVVMGTADPDFPDAEVEANDLGKLMGAEVLLVDGSGHYPQADNPGEVAPAIIDLVRRTRARDED